MASQKSPCLIIPNHRTNLTSSQNIPDFLSLITIMNNQAHISTASPTSQIITLPRTPLNRSNRGFMFFYDQTGFLNFPKIPYIDQIIISTASKLVTIGIPVKSTDLSEMETLIHRYLFFLSKVKQLNGFILGSRGNQRGHFGIPG